MCMSHEGEMPPDRAEDREGCLRVAPALGVWTPANLMLLPFVSNPEHRKLTNKFSEAPPR